MWDTLRAAARLLASHTNIVLGIAVVENSDGAVHLVKVVEPSRFYEMDVELLALAKRLRHNIPFDQLDVLVVYEMGKNISGTGMDPHVIGSWRVYGYGPREPNYRRVVVLNLTDESCGNYMGLGQADFTTCQLIEKIDARSTYVNLLTSFSQESRSIEMCIPPVLVNDRDAIRSALHGFGNASDIRLAYIKNTAWLSEFYVSEALLRWRATEAAASLKVIGPLTEFEFDQDGNLEWR